MKTIEIYVASDIADAIEQRATQERLDISEFVSKLVQFYEDNGLGWS